MTSGVVSLGSGSLSLSDETAANWYHNSSRDLRKIPSVLDFLFLCLFGFALFLGAILYRGDEGKEMETAKMSNEV